MPRDLADVLHYLLPEAEPKAARTPPVHAGPTPARRPAALPLVGVPIGERDVVRSALTWNLAVEVARLGARAVVVAPKSEGDEALLPVSGIGPVGVEVVHSDARGLGELHRHAIDVAVDRAAEAPEGGVVFVRIPPPWLAGLAESSSLLRWCLLFTSGDARELLETYGIAKLILGANECARVGITVHGARRLADAEQAFARLTRSTERHLGRELASYGLLVDDLDVYRAIVARRPIGLAHPQSPAARALRDVARLVLDDAREMAVV